MPHSWVDTLEVYDQWLCVQNSDYAHRLQLEAQPSFPGRLFSNCLDSFIPNLCTPLPFDSGRKATICGESSRPLRNRITMQIRRLRLYAIHSETANDAIGEAVGQGVVGQFQPTVSSIALFVDRTLDSGYYHLRRRTPNSPAGRHHRTTQSTAKEWCRPNELYSSARSRSLRQRHDIWSFGPMSGSRNRRALMPASNTGCWSF
jgi:hypothetical protein